MLSLLEKCTRLQSAMAILRGGSYKTPPYGRISTLKLSNALNSLVVIWHEASKLMSLQDADRDYPNSMGMMFYGDITKPSVCHRMVVVGKLCFGVTYVNKASWKADEGVITNRVVTSGKFESKINMPWYSVDFVTKGDKQYAVNLKDEVGLTTLGLTDLTSVFEIKHALKGNRCYSG